MERRADGCFVLLWLFLHVGASLNVTELPQGLLMRKMDMKLTSELWTVVITVEDGSTAWDETVATLTRLMNLDRPHMDAWSRAQLQRLGNRIGHLNHHHSRSKRGLIDGVGVVAKSLFGLATESEVAQLRERVEENRRWQRSMSTWTEDFVVVMNRTREEIALNRALLNNITERTLHAIDDVHLIMTLQEQVHDLEAISRRIDDIRDDLEHGQLTELLLPIATLQSIVGDTLPLEWYYRWCTISPSFDQGWVYEVRLPVVASDPTIGYELVAFPVWGPANRTVKLDVARYAALDTRTGQVSEPRTCRGERPLVCSNGPRTRGCTAAVVKQLGVMDVCNVLLVEEERRYFSMMENEIVAVLGKSTPFAQICPKAERPLTTQLPRGTHRITWTGGCTLETHDFSISTATMPMGHRKVDGWQIYRGKLDITDFFKNRTFPSILPPLIPLDYNRMDRPPAIQWTNPSLWPLIILLSIIIFAAALAFVLWRFVHPPARSVNRGQESHPQEGEQDTNSEISSIVNSDMDTPSPQNTPIVPPRLFQS